jgi:hypothetical protein
MEQSRLLCFLCLASTLSYFLYFPLPPPYTYIIYFDSIATEARACQMYTIARYNAKHIALTVLLSIIVNLFIYNVLSSNSIKLPCISRKECYEKAMQVGRFSSRTSSFRTRMSAFRETAIRRQEDKRRHSQGGVTLKDGQNKDPNIHGISHAVDLQERVKAAFVVLVRNRELDDMRSSMR